MSEGFAYLDIIFFAMVAGFIALRLRSVLGRKTGTEKRRTGRDLAGGESAQDNVVPIPSRQAPPPPPEPSAMDEIALVGEGAITGIRDLKNSDGDFDADIFAEGARSAFGMILDAFARGDRETLRALLADDVFENFSAAINEREANDQVLDAEIIDMSRCSLEEASLIGNRALITVQFVTEQRNTLRDADGGAVDGESEIEQIVDFWTFERDISSEDPNWRLTETRAPD